MGERLGPHSSCFYKKNSGCFTQDLCRAYGVEICFGTLNPHLSVSVSAPPDVAELKVLVKGHDACCPWSVSRSTLVESQHVIEPTSGKTAAEERVKHRVSGLVQKTEKDRKVARVALQESVGFIERVIVLTR